MDVRKKRVKCLIIIEKGNMLKANFNIVLCKHFTNIFYSNSLEQITSKNIFYWV